MFETKVAIKLDSIEKLKEYSTIVKGFTGLLKIIKGGLSYDARSIMAVISIDPSNNTYLKNSFR